MTGQNNRNVSLDALKGVSCISVVFMHCRFPGQFGSLVPYVLRFPVPVFFYDSRFLWLQKES